MKYPQLVSMPSAVSDWLEEQLEARGIDAVVYTRYILSLLHSDTVDVIYSDEDLHFSHLKKEVRRSGGSRKRFRRSADWWKYAQADAEKLKRSAAVECLMSASEQTCGIESLIDELCEKLNEIKSDAHHADPPTKKSNPEFQQVSPQELAKRYYAAFPPLNRNTSASPSKLISLIPKWIPSPKKKAAISINRKKNHRSYDNTMNASGTIDKSWPACYPNNCYSNTNQKYVREKDWPTRTVYKKLCVHNLVVRDTTEEAKLHEDDIAVKLTGMLGDSPSPHDNAVKMMNLANMRDTGRRDFIKCGTNITSSIWSNEAPMEEDEISSEEEEKAYEEKTIGPIKKNSAFVTPYISPHRSPFDNFISVSKISWTSSGDFSFAKEPECNSLFDGYDRKLWEAPSTSRWSEGSESFEEQAPLSWSALSLVKLNHQKEESAFAEVFPKSSTQNFNPFSKIIGSGLHRDTSLKTVDNEKEKDDLLTSVHSHFRPINEKVDTHLQGEYADGATFAVSSNLDKINYVRTESGAMYMENDYSMRKKYCEYKPKNLSTNSEFVLKYAVCQNDKGCQTEEENDAEVEAINAVRSTEEEQRSEEKPVSYDCTCTTLATNKDHSLGDCPVHPTRPATVLSEDVWQQQSCDKCKSDSPVWGTHMTGSKHKELGWQFGTISKIWSGGSVCHSCLGRPPSTLLHSKLREDVSQDGDQLLSEVSSVQKNYMEETTTLPLTEYTCDISDLLLPQDRKRRRHSFVSNNPTEDYPWSFASRLEESCLIQMSTIPTLRSVTL